ncbi:hypothetical protein [Polyangium sp. 6x1]|uniref:hypothetical protein n=1 Tax=Polyangium sp. 6x1 TaxID=3042689 RepID=UPI002482DFD1|nr:hypothetical protein [Polyangium sp. 6x1]MDI1442405.1 hypothetical protein [Polyangium sp. 6x1]
MTLTLLSPEAYETHVAAHYGVSPGRTPEVIAEVMRAELFALGHTLRWVLEARVLALLSRFGVTEEDVAETRRTLESVGDVAAGPGGEVAWAPLRAVLLRPGRWMIAGTLPSGDVRTALGLSLGGLPRRLSTDDDERVRRFVEEMGGRVVDVARWAGLDRVPARDRFLAELEARIDAAVRFEDRASAISWDGLEVFAPEPKQTRPEKWWRSTPLGEQAALVRARQTGGWRAYGWARVVGGKPEIVPLSGDDARRATFVLAEKAGTPVRLSAARVGSALEIMLPVLLPSAEYRWLAAVGEMLSGPRRVRLDELMFQDARVMLGQKLGVVVEEVS